MIYLNFLFFFFAVFFIFSRHLNFKFFSLIFVSFTCDSAAASAVDDDIINEPTTSKVDEKIFIADDNNDYEDLYGGRSNIADDDDDGSARFDSPSLKMSLVRGQCGYPGSPLNGRVLHLLERYEQGMVVTYECDPGYFLLGPMTRTCQSNSTWSGRMPICGMLICFDLFEKLI